MFSHNRIAQRKSNPLHRLTLLFSMLAVLSISLTAPALRGAPNKTWVTTGLQSGATDLAISQMTPATLYALSVGIPWNQVVKSIDAGVSWAAATTGFPNERINTLTVDPTDAAIVYAGMELHGVYRTTNGGASWNPINAGLPDTANCACQVAAFAIDPLTTTTLYVGFGGEVYRSTNGGANWSPVNTGLPGIGVAALAINQQATTNLYAGTGNGVYRSTNSGDTWISSTNGITDTVVTQLVIQPLNPTTLYAVTNKNGVSSSVLFRSTDGGADWSQLSFGQISVNITSLVIDNLTPSTLYVGTLNQGVLESTDSGASWTPLNSGLTNTAVNDLKQSSGDQSLYAATPSGIYRYGDTPAVPPTPTTVPATPPIGPPPLPTMTPVPGALNLIAAHVEVTQAIQDAINGVPLVANRLAMARAQIILAGANELGGIEGRLHILHNGVEVTGSPFGPNNAGRFRARPIPNLGRIDDTLNFLIPTDALQAGTTTFWVEINPNHTLQESNYADNRSVDTSLTTVAAQDLNVVIIPIAFQPNGQGPIYHIDPLSNYYWHANLSSVMPTPHVNITFHREVVYTGNVATGAGWVNLLQLLTIVRSLDRGSQSGGDPRSMPKYYGLLPDGPVLATSGGVVGGANLSGLVGAGISYPNNQLLTVHELGHTLGLLHTPCGGPANPDPSFPDPNARIGLVGVDVFNRIAYPAADADLMSYCHPAWISRYSYVKLLNVLAGTNVAPAALNTPQAQTSGMLLMGAITGASGQIDTVLPLEATNVVTGAGAGSYEIRLLNGSDATLLSYAFTPESHAEGSAEASSFSIAVPPQAGQATVELWHGVTRLSRVALAGSAPTLSAALDPLDPTMPTQRRLTWQASQASGGTAPVSVRYSPDDGVTWQTQAVDRSDGAFIIETTQLPASTNGLLELIATDIGQATTKQLRLGPIANKPPVVIIDVTQSLQVDSGGGVALSALVSDQEDGSLPDAALTWRDGSGATLGTGPTLVLQSLTGFGQRTLTLTARDSVGAETVSSVTLTVGEQLFLPLLQH